MPTFPERVGEWLLDLVGFVGLALGAGGAAAAPWLDELQQQAYDHDPARRLTPAQLAEQVVKGVTDEGAAASEARFSGVNASRFAAMVKQTGNPPGPGELLDMLRRSIIDDAGFEHGIRQGYIKTEWIDQLRRFRWRVTDVGEAVAGVVQNHLSLQEAIFIAEQHGVTHPDLELMIANHGNPPGPMEVLDLWRRGVIDEATVDQALKESRLKNKYIDALKQRAVHLVPMRTITTLLTHGAITDDRALQMLRQLGFAADDAQAIITASHFTKATPAKELSMSAIKTLYVDHMISRTDAITDLQRIGYNADIAGQILDLAEHEISVRDRRATITKIRNAYLTRRIDRANASGDLDVLGVEAGQRDQLLKVWDLELGNAITLLTPAQIVAAGKRKLFTEQEVVGRLEAHGYSLPDAIIVAMLGGAIPLPPAPSTGG